MDLNYLNHSRFGSRTPTCKVCKDTGWELYERVIFEGKAPYEFARPCTRCKGGSSPIQEDKTRVPSQFRDATLQKFGFNSYTKDISQLHRIAQDFVANYQKNWVEKGKGLYIWSTTPGTGKTFFACCIAKSAMMKNSLTMRFVEVNHYLSIVAENFKKQYGDYDESEIYRTCSLLVFDNIGAQKTGDWQEQEIAKIIEDRMNDNKPILYTSNFPPSKLNVNARIIDRIIKTSIVLQMPEESIRRKQGIKEQEDFLNRILA